MSSVEISLWKHVGFQYQALGPDYPQTANKNHHHYPQKD